MHTVCAHVRAGERGSAPSASLPAVAHMRRPPCRHALRWRYWRAAHASNGVHTPPARIAAPAAPLPPHSVDALATQKDRAKRQQHRTLDVWGYWGAQSCNLRCLVPRISRLCVCAHNMLYLYMPSTRQLLGRSAQANAPFIHYRYHTAALLCPRVAFLLPPTRSKHVEHGKTATAQPVRQ